MATTKKPITKHPKYFNGFGNFPKSAFEGFPAFPSILLKWSITSLNGSSIGSLYGCNRQVKMNTFC